MLQDEFKTLSNIQTSAGEFAIYRLAALEEQGLGRLARLPYAIRVLLEGVLRNCNGQDAQREDVLNLLNWPAVQDERPVMPFKPGRVLMQDLTGVPAVVDLAAMRAAVAKLGGDPRRINPVIPVDLVIDHSLHVDYYGSPDAMQKNTRVEFQRNRERYEFLRWGQQAFNNFRVVPPATGIVHQINLEYLASVVLTAEQDSRKIAFPDTVVGTDSHTPMINGLGVVGWGVGGIEAEAAMLGQSIDMLIPDVIGVRLTGKLTEGSTPTDLTLALTQRLRQVGVVGKFLEYFGPGMANLSLADRAMIANMTPENGSTLSFFPVDEQTLDYLRLSGRSAGQVELVETYCRAQGLLRTSQTPDPEYSFVLEFDLGTVVPALAGPKRPQDRVPLAQLQTNFRKVLAAPKNERGFALSKNEMNASAVLEMDGQRYELRHGAVVLAAITSCTNTSNPFVMLGAGLLAKKAVEKGLRVPPYVKTSLTPGSRVVTGYLESAGLLEPLALLGFDRVGYGCATCIGNSGPLRVEVVEAIQKAGLVAAAVLSGNRNFEGRVSPHTLANYLASPPLVVAYALAGTLEIDLQKEPIAKTPAGEPVYLRDIWPSAAEINAAIAAHVRPELFRERYADVFGGDELWRGVASTRSDLFKWNRQSTYIQEPPFFSALSKQPPAALNDLREARVLAMLGDSITTDHISPAGSIARQSAAAQYLLSQGVSFEDFNSYGARRGNDRVLVRGTFGNIRLKNWLVPDVEGSFTIHLPSGEQMSIFDAAERYREEGVPLIVLAGKEYGTGSSRDWAAKGPLLLGVRAVIAESYERIHRSNLVGMGVLPLQYMPGQNAASLGLTGREVFSIEGLNALLKPRGQVNVHVHFGDGRESDFPVLLRIDTPVEVDYYRCGGILHAFLYRMMQV